MPSTSSTTRVRYILSFAMHPMIQVFPILTTLCKSPCKPVPSCRHEIPAFSLQGSIRFSFRWQALLVTGKKKQQLGIQANMKTVSSAPISPFPSKSSDETLSNRKVETPGFAPHPEILSLAAQFFRLLYIISMEVFQPEKMMAAS